MQKLSKDSIIRAYNGLVKQRNGTPIGVGIFKRETGISQHYWNGTYWRSWSAFQSEAGHTPNDPAKRTPDETVFRRYAELILERGGIPTRADLRMKRIEDSSFPGEKVFRRFGTKENLLGKVVAYCEGNAELAAVTEILQDGVQSNLDQRFENLRVKGFVYLLRSGKQYKLGRTNATGRRLRELAIQLPKKPDTIHVIETDDPEGIEHYWHRRFADKRQGGEWFTLTPEDVRAFKKRRFQ